MPSKIVHWFLRITCVVVLLGCYVIPAVRGYDSRLDLVIAVVATLALIAFAISSVLVIISWIKGMR